MDGEAMEVENSTCVTPDGLKEKLVRELEATHVEIVDRSGRILIMTVLATSN